jgi:hypothetical protein
MSQLDVEVTESAADLRAREVEEQMTDEAAQSAAEAALLAKRSDVVIAFGIRVEGESFDLAETITASLAVTNTGDRAGADVPQLYLTAAAGDRRMRLIGFERVDLQPGESRRIALTADRRLLARFDDTPGQWHIAEGKYEVAVGRAADALELTADTTLAEARFGS